MWMHAYIFQQKQLRWTNLNSLCFSHTCNFLIVWATFKDLTKKVHPASNKVKEEYPNSTLFVPFLMWKDPFCPTFKSTGIMEHCVLVLYYSNFKEENWMAPTVTSKRLGCHSFFLQTKEALLTFQVHKRSTNNTV